MARDTKTYYEVGENGLVYQIVETREERRREAIAEAIDDLTDDLKDAEDSIQENEEQLGILLAAYELATGKIHPLIPEGRKEEEQDPADGFSS